MDDLRQKKIEAIAMWLIKCTDPVPELSGLNASTLATRLLELIEKVEIIEQNEFNELNVIDQYDHRENNLPDKDSYVR